MRGTVLLVAMGIWALLVTSGIAFASEATEAEAALASIGNSGVTAEIEWRDTGTSLQVTGEAEGLNPNAVYVSLIYDLGSVATGPTACDPTSNALTFEQMFMGFWLPMGSSERTLQMFNGRLGFDPSTGTFSFTSTPTPAGGKTGEFFTPIGTFATVSVRQVIDFATLNVPVRACGVVEA